MHNFKLVKEMFKNYESRDLIEVISNNDPMNNQWYFSVGRSAVEVIAAAIMASNIQNVNKALDLACGYGRVLRHIVNLFPEAEFHACDLDKDGVEFCAETFGAIPIYSPEELTDLKFESKYDLIWIGSLFTHINHDFTRRWLSHLSNFLSSQGIIIATFHGRWSQDVHNIVPYIGERKWKKIIKDYLLHGYGYHDYSPDESHNYISGSYGISLAKPHVIIRDLENIPRIRIYLYMERGWADHQDVVAFGRPSYCEPWPDP